MRPYSETSTFGDVAIMPLSMHTDWLVEEKWATDSLQNSYCACACELMFPMSSLDYRLVGKSFLPFTTCPCLSFLSFLPFSLYTGELTMTGEIPAVWFENPLWCWGTFTGM
uniref:Uncharacterized protein n=1 Tax=Rhipicephalus zambeziensis TaxID=60191 RepID=A0A224Y6N5_9ACAR